MKGKKTKRLLSLLLTFAMLLGMLPGAVFATDGDEGELVPQAVNEIRHQDVTIKETDLVAELKTLTGVSSAYYAESVTSKGFILSGKDTVGTDRNENLEEGSLISPNNTEIDWLQDGQSYTVTYYTYTGNIWKPVWEAHTYDFTYEVYHVITASVTSSGSAFESGAIAVNGKELKNGEIMEVDYGTAVTFAAVAVDGYTAGEITGVNSPVTASGTVSVVYTPNVSYAITVSENTPEAGTVKIGEAIADGSETVSVGPDSEITLTVDPEGAYYVKEVKVGGTAVEGTYENQTFTYAFTPDGETAVEVTYEEYTLAGNTDVTLYINGYLTELAEGLKDKVLDAVFGADSYNADDYTVTMLHNNLTGGTTTTDVEKMVLGAYVVSAYMDMGETETFYVIKKADNIYPEVSLEVKGLLSESRATLEITTTDVTIEEETEPADVLDQVKEAISIKATDPQTGAVTAMAVSDSYLSWEPAYAWPNDGEEKNFTVTVRVNSYANETYANAPSATLTLKCSDTTTLYTIKYVDGLGNEIASYQIAENTAPTVPADPTREFYTFAGWDPKVAETVTGDATYTAAWTADVDNNENDIADQEETYTVVYKAGYEGAEDLGTFENLAWGDATPTIANPTREGWNFKGWDVSPAETVVAPASGNTITYTAQWTQLHAVIFMNGGEQHKVDEVENNQKVAKPTDPTWDEDHDFLGWYYGENEFDFDTAVTGNLTLTARWQDDFNHNDIDDATENRFTVTYKVDETETSFESILTGMPTPAFDADPDTEANQDPSRIGYIFNGWEPEVAETVTGDVTYTAKWLADSNDNGVADVNETITITVNKANDADDILVVGASRIGDTDNYLFDSTVETTVSVTANPVTTLEDLTFKSTTYVHSVEGGEGEGSYSEVNYAYTYKFAPANGQVVTVTFAEAKFEYYETRQMDYYPGMTGILNSDVYGAVVKSPAYDTDACTITYKAREAMSQTVQLSSLGLSDSILNVLKLMGIESFDFDMPALWLDVNVETGSMVENSVSLDQAVSQYLTSEKINGLWDVYKAAAEANGGLILGASAGRKAVEAEIDEIYTNIYNAAMYYGAHNFGYNATDAETVTEAIKVTFKNTALYMEGETDITLKDVREPSTVVGNNVSVMYKDYSDEELAKVIGAYVTDKDGTWIENAVLTSLELTDPYTFEGKAVSDTAYELTFRFDGNETYKPSEATFTVTITKATISTFDIADVTVEYGTAYSMEPTVVLGNKYGEVQEVTDSQITFLIGLDVAELDVDADGVKGLNSHVQLILPADLQKTLDAIFGGDGVSMSMSELIAALEGIDDQSLDVLKQALTAIQSITETGNITIVVGGGLPTDIGAYLYGAVTTSPNYETAMDVAYIVITPAATEVYLDWNYSDTNGVFTHELLQHVNLGASAYEDAALTTKDDAATALVNNLFFGIDISGNLVAELFNAGVDPETLEDTLHNGAYTQMAFVSDFGNDMYYAVPVVRAFLIAPNSVNVVFTEDAGEDHLMHRTYNGEAQVLDVDVIYDGTVITPDKKWLTVTYTGLQSDGEAYGPTTVAPGNTGLYTVSATYIHKDENGEIIAVGANAVLLAIEPSDKLTAQVVDTTVGYDGKAHTPEIQFSIDGAAVDASEVDVTYCVLNKADHTLCLVTEGNSKSLIRLIEDVTGKTIDGSSLTSFQNMVIETLTALEEAASDSELAAKAEELFGTEAIEVLTQLQNILAQAKEVTTGYTYTVSVNANMPTDVGIYQVYVLAAAENYVPTTAQGTLEIKHIDIVVTVDSLTKYCGQDDPDYSYEVAYFDYEGNSIEGPETDVSVTFTREAGETVGEYKITAEADVKNDNYQVVSVTEDAVLKILPISVTGVTLDKTTLSLVEGESETLTATAAPENATDKSVTWESSDSAVATVDENGVVSAVAAGSATITVTTTDGEKTATCEVTVCHSPEKTEAKEATCTEAGNSEYYTCTGCGKYFSDEACTVEIEEGSWVIPAKGHSLEKTEAKEAGCTEDGVKGYWTCTACNKYFSDAEGKNEIADLDAWKTGDGKIPATGHTPGDWEHDKDQHWCCCTVCDAELDRGDHTFKGRICTECGYSRTLRFVDVPDDAYYFNAVYWAADNGIVYGTTDITFEPDKVCTRAEAAAFLWRAAGRPEPTTTENPFVDVSKNAYYYKAILWGVENHIIFGTSATTFEPNAPCTRGQIAAFLWRLEGRPEPETTSNPFTDVEEGIYYNKAVIWGHENGIIYGTSETAFSPKAYCTRAQIVSFLYRTYGK